MPTAKKDGKEKPQFRYLFRFVCPYCGVSPLCKTWFTFQHGCLPCNYRFERELGYYTGASWMVTFPLVSLASFFVAALLMWQFPNLSSLWVASTVSIFMLLLGVLITPLCMAIWLYVDHWLHPLHDGDDYNKELLN
jgi:uncharacterized protein (DUF983 family)